MNLQSFEYYLREENLTERTIFEHLRNVERFAEWLKQNDEIADESVQAEIMRLRYNDLLQYVQYMKNKGLCVPTQNIRINSMRKYFEHLKQESQVEVNPARRLFIKGAVKKITHNPLSYLELEQLYHEYIKPWEFYKYKRQRIAHERNKVILGLMIFQAVHGGELVKLELHHVKLSEGTVYIPGTRRSNGRELQLDSKQILALHHYLTETNFKSEKLFNSNPHNDVHRLINELKGINPVVKNLQHIRASVILHWMRMYNKREVQYMIGHKCIGSTERYQVQELEGLTDMLAKHHPFG